MKKNLCTILLAFTLIGSCKNQTSNNSQPDYLAIGDSLSRITFEKLSGILKNKITTEGFPASVEYCQLEAPALTGSFANAHTKIRRTTLKPRNENNAASPLERDVLEIFQTAFDKGDSLKPLLKTDAGGNMHYFKAILLQPLCSGCHGEPGKEIATATLEKIREKYPDDLATGYKPGDLRGAWHIIFYKK